MADMQNPIFQDETKAREFLEAVRWPDGPVCPHCGCFEKVTRLEGKKHRPGLWQCNACLKQFSVTVGTVFERSHVPLTKWLLAAYLMCSSKKGISSHQLHRMLGVTYKTAWFMSHRIREGMREGTFSGPLGGQNKVVEVDETYIGGRASNRKNVIPPKEAVVALVERGGEVRSFHLGRVNARTLRPVLDEQLDKRSYLMTDEARMYPKAGEQFAGHGTVNHSMEEYVRTGFWHTNTVENYFSILKRGMTGVYQHCSPQHLKRYVGEFDFRYNARSITDAERAKKALKGIEGKRLTYRRTNEQPEA